MFFDEVIDSLSSHPIGHYTHGFTGFAAGVKRFLPCENKIEVPVVKLFQMMPTFCSILQNIHSSVTKSSLDLRSFWFHFKGQVRMINRDVGSISNLGGTTLRGHFFH